MIKAQYKSLLKEIQDLVSWHCDFDAEEYDESPEDMVAHVNGIIYQKIERVLKDA